MLYFQNFQVNKPMLASRVFCAFVLISSEEALAKEDLNPLDIKRSEELIAVANGEELSKLEIKIARILQEHPRDLNGSYLMSTLLLRMFTVEPGNYGLIRQSTELAAQTYDLDKKSDLSIAALANILEVTGENDRGLALLRDSKNHGIKLGWRSNLARAKLTFNGKNTESVLKILDDVMSDPDVSNELAAGVIVDAINARYDGPDLIEKLRTWSHRCPSLTLNLAVANALSINARYKDAMAIFEKITTEHPNNSEALLSQGIIALRHMNNFDFALKKLRLAITASKDPVQKSAALTHLAIGLIIQNKNPEEMRDSSATAVANSTDQETTLVAILSAYRRHSSVNSILMFLNQLEKTSPGLHLAHALKAETLSEKLGRHHEATRAYTNAITLEPRRGEYYNGRGLAWMGIGKLELALEDFENASDVNPDDASARYNIACAQARLGMSEESLTSLAKAFSLDERLVTTAKSDHDLKSLRDDSRFQGLVTGDSKEFTVAH